jgi:hypothetical protein
VKQLSVVNGKVWLVCDRCHLRWSVGERRSAAASDYEGSNAEGP